MENGKGKKIDLVEQARQLRLQVEQLEKNAKLARGTSRIKRPTQNVIVKPSVGPYFIGDEGSTEELMATITRMLQDRPCRFQEILEATGARDNRIKGVINRLQREGVRIVDVAPEGSRAALWFIPSNEVLDRIMRAKRRATERR
jgi:transcription antitermination factor NusA-like protein